MVIGDNGVEQTNLFTVSFDKVLDISSKRKQSSKFTLVSLIMDVRKILIYLHVHCTYVLFRLDSVQKPSTHSDLLKD